MRGPTALTTALTAALLCAASLVHAGQRPAPDQGAPPPSRREQQRLVEEYAALAFGSEEERARAAELLPELARIPFPDARGRGRWETTFAKLRQKAPRLPRTAGEHFDLGEGRGRYFIAGELRRPSALFVGMHGGGVGSGDADSAHASYRDAVARRGWLGIFPEVLEKTERGWTDAGTDEWVLSLVERALATFEIDPDRVYLGGHSMGGYGSWVLGAQHADRVAALVPSAGGPTPVYGADGRVQTIQRGVVPNLRNVPMCVFQSTDDPKVGPEANQAAVREVERARERWGGYEHFEYWEVSDRGHGWPAGGVEALLSRIEGHARDPRPARVVWQPGVPWKTRFYWLEWPSPELFALVDARVDRGRNRIEIDALSPLRLPGFEPAGLALLLGPELIDLEAELTVVVNGTERFRGPVQPDFATWIRTALDGDPGRTFLARLEL